MRECTTGKQLVRRVLAGASLWSFAGQAGCAALVLCWREARWVRWLNLRVTC
jgi:hypothetical protein